MSAETALTNGMGVEADAEMQGFQCVSIHQGTTDTWCKVTCMATMCPETLCKCANPSVSPYTTIANCSP